MVTGNAAKNGSQPSRIRRTGAGTGVQEAKYAQIWSDPEQVNALFEGMVKDGMLKIVGHTEQAGRSVPVYDAVPVAEWPAEARAELTDEELRKLASDVRP